MVKKAKSKKRQIFSIVLIVVLLSAGGTFFYFTRNFNILVRDKIISLYSQSEVSNYYNLRFDKLRVNLLTMSVRIFDVSFTPLEDKHPDFFEKNGSLSLKVGKIIIKKADLFDFLANNEVTIKQFTLANTAIKIENKKEKFSPFAFIRDTKSNDSLKLKITINHIKFDKTKLRFVGNEEKDVEYKFRDFSMNVDSVSMNKKPGDLQFSFSNLLALLTKAKIKSNSGLYLSLDELRIGVSQLNIKNTLGRFNLDYQNFFIALDNPSLTTADSLYTISVGQVLIEEKKNKLSLHKIEVHPNLSKAAFVRRFKYQTLRPEITAGRVEFKNLQYEKLINERALAADTLTIIDVYADLYKDKNFPQNTQKFPNYLGKQVFGIKIPVNIKVVKAENIDVDFAVKQENGKMSKIDVSNISGVLYNLQNQDPDKNLILTAKGRVHNVIPFSVKLDFNTQQDIFRYSGKIYKSDLSKLSKVVRSFAPVSIKSGKINSLTFNGYASRTDTRGTMLFLYNDLNISIEKKDENKKKDVTNLLFSMAANTYIYSNNPAKDNPPRKVSFFKERNMNKGFIHLLIQGLLSGIKESVAPSKENRQKYKEVKRSTKDKKSVKFWK
jgi:hypothetical protein